MASRKKGSELVFNLQWRNKLDNGGDKSNIIGMYDTPATTQNFELFKSYLLKNSGVVANDLKVTYLTDDGTEWMIDSQKWFEIALCAFRLKAKLGEVIFLKLDKIHNSASHQKVRKHSNDVETQFDDTIINQNGPPEWFLSYMKQFKRDVVEEVTCSVNSTLTANSKEKEVAFSAPVVVFPKKFRPECSKRSRKHVVLGENPIDKELLKTLKYDRKIENKLDKLDAKTKKIKEKKQALISKIDCEEHHRHGNKHQSLVDVDGAPLLNATLVSESTVLPHMVGGETYLHTWEVMNNGKLPWTKKTELRLTWGSADMKPSSNVIRCPPLLPGERGLVCVRFQIPKNPGQYESYWNFFENEVRFGHWLSCRVIVDDPISYRVENSSSKKPKIEQENVPLATQTLEKSNSPKHFVPQDNFLIIQGQSTGAKAEAFSVLSDDLIGINKRMHDMKIAGATQVDSDSDWESLGSCAGARKPKSAEEKAMDDFDPLKTNKYGIQEKDLIVDLSKTKEETKPPSSRQSPVEEVKKDSVEKQAEEVAISNDDNNNNGTSVNNNSSGESIEIESEASDLSSGYDIISVPMCDEKEDGSEYVYITVDGNKLPVPKHIIRPDFLEKVEEVPGPISSENDDEKTVTEDATEEEAGQKGPRAVVVGRVDHLEPEQVTEYAKSFIRSVQSPIGEASFADVKPGQHTRVFIFPQDNPGFEVLYYPKGMGDGTEVESLESPWHRISYYPNGLGSFNEVESATAINTEASQQIETGEKNFRQGGTPQPSAFPYGFAPVVPQPTNTELHMPRGNVSCPTNTTEAMPTDPVFNYTWAHSETQYTFPDLQSACAAHLKCDPYGPLEQSTPASSQEKATNQAPKFQHIPNYQQSTPKQATVQGQKSRYVPLQEQTLPKERSSHKLKTPSAPPQTPRPASSEYLQSAPVHILPENLVSGAVNVASSAINTARSVISMIVPPKTEPGKWVNGHWVTENPQSKRAENLCILADMGFWDTDLNATLLARYNDDVTRVVSELLQ